MLHLELTIAAIDRERLAKTLERLAEEIRTGVAPCNQDRKRLRTEPPGVDGSVWLQDTELLEQRLDQLGPSKQ